MNITTLASLSPNRRRVGSPVGGGGGTDNWATRSAGALSADRLDTQAARDNWVFVNAFSHSEVNVFFDSAIKSGASLGSLKIACLNTAATDDGALRFPMGRSFNPGDTYCLSYRMRAPAGWVYQPWSATPYQCYNKTCIVDPFGATSTGDEVVPTMQYNVNEFGGYHQDGTGSFPSTENDAFVSACSSSDLMLQYLRDNGANTLTGVNPDTGSAWSACEQDRRRYASLYSARNGASNVRPGIGDPFGGGMKMKPDTWYTITLWVTIGTPGVANSRWRHYVAEDGHSYQKLWDRSDIKFGTSTSPDTAWFMTYVTGRSAGGRKVTGIDGSIGGISVPTCGMGTEMGSCTLEYTAATGRFRFRTPGDGYGTSRGFSVTNNIVLINVSSASDRAVTTLTTNFTLPQSSIPITDASAFPSSGTVVIGSPVGGAGGVGEERVQYTGKTGNTLTGCSGGTGAHTAGQGVNFASYVVVRIDNPAALPSSGTTTMTVTVADGRPDVQVNYADAICSLSPIISPFGDTPS